MRRAPSAKTLASRAARAQRRLESCHHPGQGRRSGHTSLLIPPPKTRLCVCVWW